MWQCIRLNLKSYLIEVVLITQAELLPQWLEG